jgi:hypothetical protein
MEAKSTDDIGVAAEIRRFEESDNLLFEMDEWEDRAEATEEDGDEDRGVVCSELLVELPMYEAMA